MDVAEQRARAITIDGNRLTFDFRGPEILAALMKLIDGAKTSLRLLYYIYTARPDRRAGQGRADPGDRPRGRRSRC